MTTVIQLITFLLSLCFLANCQLPAKERTIIKSPLPIPKVGIVCSNPDRARLIATEHFDYYFTHTDFRGYKVYVGKYNDAPLFVSYVGLGSASAFFMGEELVSAGAETIVRLGTNDFNTTIEDINKVFVVEKCYGLVGLMQDMGMENSSWGQGIPSDKALVQALMDIGQTMPEIQVKQSTGYNIDAFYAFLDPENVAVNPQGVLNLEKKYSDLGASVRDMETCAILLLGQVRKIRTASVLQAVVKHDPTKHEDTGTTGIKLVLETLRKEHHRILLERK
mmetsp:Transcript_3435/g.13068  ORF Transcript_3435/g.13068 Transcript_3435/m.13068 type:complete len:278 (-) Transcript_3435:94-927(-)